MIITIGGTPGSGKGTVGKSLAKQLGYKYYSMGDVQGEAAKAAGMTLPEWQEHLKVHPEFEYKMEEFQKELGKQDNIILDSRLGFFCIPHALKVFLSVELQEGAKRIAHTKRDDEHYTSAAEAAKALQTRIQFEREQYKKLYGVDHYEMNNYDLVVDTTRLTPEQVVEKILEKI